MIALLPFMGGAHTLVMGDVWVYFSNETPMAFRHKTELVVRAKECSSIREEHLNNIDGGVNKENRIPGEEFEARLEQVLNLKPAKVNGPITISQEQYKILKTAQLKLSYLECGGVDNWEGYNDSMSKFYDFLLKTNKGE